MESKETIVIGAGICGLLCAQGLKDSGVDVTVLEKSRGVGGRMATRRIAGGRADHGVQLFTARDLRFQMIVDEWLEEGVCKRWYVSKGSDSELGAQGYVRYCGKNGMTEAPKWIAQFLDVRKETIVEKTVYSEKDKKWIIWVDGKPAFECKSLFITAPLPQALNLLEAGNSPFEISIHDELKGVRYQKGLTVMAVMDGPSGISEHGGLRVNKNPITWISDNQAKGISPDLAIVTIHTTPAFAEEQWNASNEKRVPLIIEAAKPYLQSEIMEWQCHRWSYSFPVNPWHDICVQDKDRNLFLAGDAFGGPRVEGAALSGIMAAAEYIDQRA